MSFQKFGKQRFGIGPFVKGKQWTKQTDPTPETWSKRSPHGNH